MAIDQILEPKWYVIHTYAGYENQVKKNLEKIIDNRGLHDYILRVEIPVREFVETKNGKRKTVTRKIFPSYVLVQMSMNDDLWSIVRHTNGVTGFVGPGSKPAPLSDKELSFMGVDLVEFDDMGLEVGGSVKIISGPFANLVGKIMKISKNKRCITVGLSVFDRDMPVDFDISQIQKL